MQAKPDAASAIVARNTPPTALHSLVTATDPFEFLGGAATGAAVAPFGMAGDVESIGRTVARAVPGGKSVVGDKTMFPTSDALGDALVGKPNTPAASAGRMFGQVIGPAGAVKAVAKAAPVVGRVASGVTGLVSGTSGRAVEEAFKAGQTGGQQAKIFLDNMTKKAPLDDVVDSARKAVSTMKLERQAAYKAEMAGTKQSVAFADFAPIDAALAKTKSIGLNRTGQIETIPGAQQVHKAISDVVAQWRSDPMLRTPEDLDEMKKAINNLQYHGELKNIAGPGTPGAIIIREARDAISKEITNKVGPEYAKAMNSYSEASDLIDEMNRALSVNDKATVDTTLRKLQSVMRDNVQTSYGHRTKLAETLDSKAKGEIFPALAGQALSSWEPRGLSRYLAGTEALTGHAGLIPFSSPRAVGNMAYQAGRWSRPIAKYVTPGNALYTSLASQLNNAGR
jgi:hypothetical protein